MRIRERFNPRAPCGARPAWRSASLLCVRFQPTRPLRGATSRAGQTVILTSPFQPTRPLRGATLRCGPKSERTKFQPTRPLRGATKRISEPIHNSSISTHAPLAGRDGAIYVTTVTTDGISTHAPLAGRDGNAACSSALRADFNPRAPCGARHIRHFLFFGMNNFNPRAPCGARRRESAAALASISISTHAPLAGRDSVVKFNDRFHVNFNPRAPCGARHDSYIIRYEMELFQPTRPLRGAT